MIARKCEPSGAKGDQRERRSLFRRLPRENYSSGSRTLHNEGNGYANRGEETPPERRGNEAEEFSRLPRRFIERLDRRTSCCSRYRRGPHATTETSPPFAQAANKSWKRARRNDARRLFSTNGRRLCLQYH